jgi:hypothetical protein
MNTIEQPKAKSLKSARCLHCGGSVEGRQVFCRPSCRRGYEDDRRKRGELLDLAADELPPAA